MHRCAFCQSETDEVLDFGRVALAGAFIKCDGIPGEKKYPLRLMFCQTCFAVQVADPVGAETLFRDYFYFSSQIDAVRRHFKGYAADVMQRFAPESVLEIGCNDGYLLGKLADAGVKCIGVDPAKNVVASITDNRLTLVNSFFDEAIADEIVTKHGKQSLILANNVFAHVPDIHGMTRAICKTLTDDGVLVVETQHLGAMIAGLQYDWIYHEHLYYYSALSLSKHLAAYGLEIFDVQDVEMHGGSKRYYIGRQGHRAPAAAVRSLMDVERKDGLDRLESFLRFADDVRRHRFELRGLIDELKADGATICGYGASGRANTILQWLGLDASHLAYIIDDAPAKAGFYTPGSHIPIYPRSSVKVTLQRYTLILAWPYAEDILRNIENTAIIPLPVVRIVPAKAKGSGWSEMDGIGQWRTAA